MTPLKANCAALTISACWPCISLFALFSLNPLRALNSLFASLALIPLRAWRQANLGELRVRSRLCLGNGRRSTTVNLVIRRTTANQKQRQE